MGQKVIVVPKPTGEYLAVNVDGETISRVNLPPEVTTKNQVVDYIFSRKPDAAVEIWSDAAEQDLTPLQDQIAQQQAQLQRMQDGLADAIVMNKIRKAVSTSRVT